MRRGDGRLGDRETGDGETPRRQVSKLKGIRAEVEELAREVYARWKALATEPPNWRAATLDGFPELSRTFYDEATEWLVDRGFRVLGDFENETFGRQNPDVRTVIRVASSSDGSVVAEVYHLLARGALRLRALGFDGDGRPLNRRTVSFSTEFTDRTLLVTLNSGGAPRFRWPRIEEQSLAEIAEPPSLLKVHWTAVERRLSRDPPVVVTPVRCAEDCFAAERRAWSAQAAHLLSIGYVDEGYERARWRWALSGAALRMLEAEIARLKSADHPPGVAADAS